MAAAWIVISTTASTFYWSSILSVEDSALTVNDVEVDSIIRFGSVWFEGTFPVGDEFVGCDKILWVFIATVQIRIGEIVQKFLVSVFVETAQECHRFVRVAGPCCCIGDLFTVCFGGIDALGFQLGSHECWVIPSCSSTT